MSFEDKYFIWEYGAFLAQVEGRLKILLPLYFVNIFYDLKFFRLVPFPFKILHKIYTKINPNLSS